MSSTPTAISRPVSAEGPVKASSCVPGVVVDVVTGGDVVVLVVLDDGGLVVVTVVELVVDSVVEVVV